MAPPYYTTERNESSSKQVPDTYGEGEVDGVGFFAIRACASRDSTRITPNSDLEGTTVRLILIMYGVSQLLCEKKNTHTHTQKLRGPHKGSSKQAERR